MRQTLHLQAAADFNRAWPSLAPVGLLFSLMASPAAADSGQTGSAAAAFVKDLHPFVAVGLVADSNLFRLPDPLPDGLEPRDGFSDQFATLSAGIDTSFRLSQQEFALAGEVIKYVYNSYDELDYTGGNAIANWKWEAGDALTGNAGYRYDRKLRSFVNRNDISRETARDIRTEDALYGDVNLQFWQNWYINVRGDWAFIDFSASPALELERFTAGASINFVSNSENILGLDGEITEGEYKFNTQNNFEELDVGPVFDWKLGAQTKLRGKIGYTRRDYTDSARIDYDDFTGRVVFLSKSAKGNILKMSVWRELSNLGDEIATFALVQGVSIDPSWQVTRKIALRFTAAFEDRDFDGADPTVDQGGFADRRDKLYTGLIAADWQITRPLLWTIGFDFQKRTSNREFRDFEDRMILTKLTFSL